ncbi:MAG TPA: hypothetical protein VD948_08085, partial [Rhodothermales bacterium]|nr:hypothetical protein [Rhodothermales bacterium]
MRLYDDKDVSALLRRAAELQARAEGGTTSGLTLEELQNIAREVGIDPRYVEQAARTAGQTQVKDGTTYFWGAPSRATAERLLPGPVSDDLWETVVMEARRTFGQTGKTDQVGRNREWRWDYYGTYTMAFVSASPRKGQTALHVERRLDNEGVVAYLPLMMTALLAGILLPLKFGLVGLGAG